MSGEFAWMIGGAIFYLKDQQKFLLKQSENPVICLKVTLARWEKKLDLSGFSKENFARKARDVLDEMVQRKVESTNLLVEKSVWSTILLSSSDW